MGGAETEPVELRGRRAWSGVVKVVVVQSLSYVQLFVALWTAARQASLTFTISQSLLRFILCRPLLLLPSIFPSIRVSSNESGLHIRWPKYLSFSFSISPSNEHSGLISFRVDWFDLLAVQGTLKSLLQHHSLKASIFLCSAFLMVQLSHLYITTGQSLDSTRWMFVSKAMSLLFNMLSGLSLEKAMAPHSSILAWKFPWTEDPWGYSPWGPKESDTTE